MAERRGGWNAARVRRLRAWLKLTQQAFADEMGVRQQTVSEWETGVYRPRGASTRLLDIVAERVGFAYGQGSGVGSQGRDEGSGVRSHGPDEGSGVGGQGPGTAGRERDPNER